MAEQHLAAKIKEIDNTGKPLVLLLKGAASQAISEAGRPICKMGLCLRSWQGQFHDGDDIAYKWSGYTARPGYLVCPVSH